MRSLARLCAVMLVLSSPTLAFAERFASKRDYVQLELADGLQALEPQVSAGAGTRLVAAFRSDSLQVAITRVDVPNPRAWKGDGGYFDELEDGVRGAAPGYRRRYRKVHVLGRVPTLDLDFERSLEGGRRERVATRLLLFRTFAVALTVSPTSSTGFDRARSLRSGFRPYFGD